VGSIQTLLKSDKNNRHFTKRLTYVSLLNIHGSVHRSMNQ